MVGSRTRQPLFLCLCRSRACWILLEFVFDLVGDFVVKFLLTQLLQLLQDLWNLTVNRL